MYIVLSSVEAFYFTLQNSIFNTQTLNLATPVKLYVRATKELKKYVLLMQKNGILVLNANYVINDVDIFQ